MNRKIEKKKFTTDTEIIVDGVQRKCHLMASGLVADLGNSSCYFTIHIYPIDEDKYFDTSYILYPSGEFKKQNKNDDDKDIKDFSSIADAASKFAQKILPDLIQDARHTNRCSII